MTSRNILRQHDNPKAPNHALRRIDPSLFALTPAELKQIDAVAPHGVAMGDRYADMSSVNR